MVKKLLLAVAVGVLVFLASQIFGDYTYPAVVNGDVNMDGQVCMDDSIQILNHLWIDGRELPCPDAADLDRSGVIDVNDVIAGLRYVFYGEAITDCPISCY